MTHQELLQVINEHDFTATPCEFHGLLSGLVAGGMFKGSKDHLEHLSELFNSGLTIKGSIKVAANKLVDELFEQFASEDMSFKLMALDEDDSLTDQAEELINWVQYFLVGFGLNKHEIATASTDIREIIEDFTNITRMDAEMDDTNENQADFYEVAEFIRVSAILVYQEFGKPTVHENDEKRTLH